MKQPIDYYRAVLNHIDEQTKAAIQESATTQALTELIVRRDQVKDLLIDELMFELREIKKQLNQGELK